MIWTLSNDVFKLQDQFQACRASSSMEGFDEKNIIISIVV
jgi:hypothetical protein